MTEHDGADTGAVGDVSPARPRAELHPDGEALHLTQPAVTQQMRSLQAYFKTTLVDLVGRRAVLSDAGAFLAARTDVVLDALAALERDMREFADTRAGELRIGATLTIGSHTLPDLVARFQRTFPGISLRVDVDNTAAIGRAVKAGRVNLALVEGPLADDDLEITPYDTDELILVTQRGHPLARPKRPIEITDLRGLPFVMREQGSGSRAQVERTLLAAGVQPVVALTLPGSEGIVRAVELGIGVAIVSRLVVATAIRARRIVHVPIRGVTLERTFRVVRLRRHTPSPAALAFAALL